MASYILRKIDEELWHQVKTRALSERLTLRQVIQALLEHYAAGKPLDVQKPP